MTLVHSNAAGMDAGDTLRAVALVLTSTNRLMAAFKCDAQPMNYNFD